MKNAAAPAGPFVPSGPRLAYAAFGVGLGLALLLALFIDTAAAPALYLLGSGYGTALSLLGVRRMPRGQRRAWVAIATAQCLFFLGDVLWTIAEDVLQQAPSSSPSIMDIAYAGAYPALLLGLVVLVRRRSRGRDRAAFLDAAIIATPATVCGLVFVVLPLAQRSGATWLTQAAGAAYPAADLLALALILRLLMTAGGARNTALWGLLTGVALLLAGDVTYGISAVSEESYPAWIRVSFALAPLCIGVAALHPSARVLLQPAPQRPDGTGRGRLGWLGLALMLGPITDVLAEHSGLAHGSWVVLAGGCLVAVLVVMRLWHLFDDLQRKAVQLAALARKDGLTGVANRRTWDHELSRACAFAREHGTPLTVALLDLDHFKQVNDAGGHVAGDRVLKETAAAWSAIVEGRGFLARYGGEEFAVLLPGLDRAAALAVLEQMRRAVTHGQTCSVGVAAWDWAEAPARLVGRADQALYLAKASGRDRIAAHEAGNAAVVSVDQTPAPPVLRTVYQPIVDLHTGEVIGAEALSRFEGGADPRTVFDDAARNGTGPALEAAALASAIEHWDGSGLLTVNLSLSALVTPAVQAALPQDLSGVVVEITEADLVEDTAEVMLAIEGIRARGALLAIDDFGIGFSNVRRIATMRPDIIKIDMSLIRDIDTNPTLQAVAASCVMLGDLTQARVIAEGIETPQERETIARLGVGLGQGYLLGAPAPPDPAASADVADAADVGDVADVAPDRCEGHR